MANILGLKYLYQEAAIDEGAELVMGSRLRGDIEEGAMPRLHRHLGTPVLTFLVNRLFGTRISDVNCGQRALRRSRCRQNRVADCTSVSATLAKTEWRELIFRVDHGQGLG